MENKMWVYMLQLGTNMWRKKGRQSSKRLMDEEAYYRDYLNCDKETWRKVTEFLPSCGINTVLIDMGEGVKLDSHPELAVEGSWSKEEFREELKRLRSMGLTPIPKFNFSSGHSAWLQDYAYMVGTPKYYEVCKDIIEETIELYDTPEFFHLGMEEEDAESQKNQPVAIVRAPYKKMEDMNFMFDVCRSKGVRPWIWLYESDVDALGGEEAFRKGIGKDVLISAWYYKAIPDSPTVLETHACVRHFKRLGEWGYEQIPTASTWAWHLNNKETMTCCKNHVDPNSIRGYMTASWHMTMPKKYYALLNDAFTFYNARKDVYGDIE